MSRDIIRACIEGDHGAVARLLADDPECVHQRDDILGSTPLIFAAHRGFESIVELLLDAGADIDAREQASDSTALHWVAEAGHRNLAATLLDRGADPHAIDSWYALGPVGWTTVAECRPDGWRDRDPTRDFLIERGGELDPFTAVLSHRLDALHADHLDRRLGFVLHGRTPLHLAVIHERVAAVERLLALGADPTRTDHWGVSVLAEVQRYPAVAYLFADYPTDLSTALIVGELDRARGLVGHGIPTGLLSWCAHNGESNAVSWLLEHGADASEHVAILVGERKSHVTPLHLAARHGDRATLDLLLEATGNVDPTSPETAVTPLHLAAIGDSSEATRRLLDQGADPSRRDTLYQATPLGWACHFEHDDVIAILRDVSPED
ncbi:MAG: ankyrin repeat domain-containing protein [Acidobacteriota bacterium]